MIPLRDENPSLTVPVVTRLLIALNAIAFLGELALGPDLRGFFYAWGLVPARMTLAIQHTSSESIVFPAVTIFSSMFMHGGWLHLAGNMWYLWIFGDNVEDRLGHGRFLLFYLFAGIASGILHWVFNATSVAPTVGASGAIAGVLGAYLVAFPHARVITLVPLFPFFRVMALPAVLVLGLWIVMQLFSGAFSLGSAASSGGVAWWGHIGGFLFGLAVMAIVRVSRPRPSSAWVE
jgi:membrane associated rhomboid family serine protease